MLNNIISLPNSLTAGKELYICDICHEEWKEDWNQRTYSICHFVAVYALPVSLVLTAYIRMGCKLCTPSDIVNNRDGQYIKSVYFFPLSFIDGLAYTAITSLIELIKIYI